MRKLNTAADAPAAPPRFDVSTWTDQARRLARNEAEAASLRLVLVLIVIGLLGAAVVVFFDLRPPRDPAQIGVAIAAALIIVALRWLHSYSSALGRNTHEVRRATWQEEIARNKDLDNDGVIGDPFRSMPVKRQGKNTETVIYDLPSNSERNAPVMESWGVSQADLVSFLFEAERGRGLQETTWVGKKASRHVLPSGRVVTQALFRDLVQALADHGMAIKQANRWELDVRAEDIATALKP